jgi:GNAT superfamily N-acetyltransferase
METTSLSAAPRSLLRRLYDELLEPAFPPAELITYDELEGAVASGDATGLVLTEGDDPLAAVVTEGFLDGRVTLLSYLVVSAGHRSRGLGTQLLDRACASTTALVLAEIEDPRFHAADQLTGDPAARLRFYLRYGSMLLPIPYAQPSLRPDVPRVEDMLLITIPSAIDPAPDLDGTLVAAFLEEYFHTCEGVDVDREPDYQSMRAAALGPAGRLTLVSLDALDAVRPRN